MKKVIHPDDRDFVIKQSWKKQEGDKNVVTHYSYRGITKSGDVRWIDQFSKTILYNGKMANLMTFIDITERKLAEEALQESKAFFQNIFDTIQDGITVLDTDMNIVRINKAMEQWYQPKIPYTGKKCYEAFHGRYHICKDCPAAKTLESGSPRMITLPRGGTAGTSGWVEAHAFPMTDSSGKLSGVVEYVRNISGRKRLEEELTALATTDALTGVNNRRSFLEKAVTVFASTRRYEKFFSVLMFDIDHFKRVNDTFGHQAGDKVLKAMAETCVAGLRETDIFGRMGGEEFAAVLTETGIHDAVNLAERLRHDFSKLSVKIGGESLGITVSIGVSTFENQDKSLEDIIKWADIALYKAKNKGRNRSL